MLNRTQNPFLFSFNPFSLTPPPPPTLAAAQKMESIEGGMKIEDLMVNYGQIDAAGEAFFVEDLLVDGGDGFFEAETVGKNGCETEDKNPISLSTFTKPEEIKANGFGSPVVDVFGSVPDDDVADLEWLSHFVEESFSSHSMTYQWSEPTASKTPSEAAPNPTKAARTKRARTGGRVWSSPAAGAQRKKTKRKKNTTPAAGAAARRCSHCGVQKTPQWRAGPMGAKTLCNACGVRFKSGRLFPEYRPACSPTFSSDVHSNNHRKVLEIRMKHKINADEPEPDCFFKKLGELTD